MYWSLVIGRWSSQHVFLLRYLAARFAIHFFDSMDSFDRFRLDSPYSPKRTKVNVLERHVLRMTSQRVFLLRYLAARFAIYFFEKVGSVDWLLSHLVS